MRCPTGGIRTYDHNDFTKDELVFMKKLREWNVIPNDYEFFVLDNGIGDHFAFKSIIKEYIELHKDKKIILFTCFPQVFEDVPEIRQSSIAVAKMIFGDISRFDAYIWMPRRGWTQPLQKAFADMVGVKSLTHPSAVHGNGSSSIVVISPYSQTPDHAKSYPYWEELVKLLNSCGVKVVQIGRSGEPEIAGVHSIIYDYSFSKIDNLVSKCRTWISVDNFLPHLVNCMDKPVVGHVIFSQSDPKIFGYGYNNNILKSRKFLRAEQFRNWVGVEQRREMFDSAKDMFVKIKGFTNLCLEQSS